MQYGIVTFHGLTSRGRRLTFSRSRHYGLALCLNEQPRVMLRKQPVKRVGAGSCVLTGCMFRGSDGLGAPWVSWLSGLSEHATRPTDWGGGQLRFGVAALRSGYRLGADKAGRSMTFMRGNHRHLTHEVPAGNMSVLRHDQRDDPRDSRPTCRRPDSEAVLCLSWTQHNRALQC